MIGKLKGIIDEILEDKIILDVSGVGYEVFMSLKNLDKLQNKKDQSQKILIETIVREDQISLYGFLEEIEKSWFKELTKVGGVGNKVALKILGTMTISEINLSLNSGDKTLFSKVPGIGSKLAARIVGELKDIPKKIGGEFKISGNFQANNNSKNSDNKIITDAISALENLGYKRNEIFNIICDLVSKNPDITLETLITNSLRLISKS